MILNNHEASAVIGSEDRCNPKLPPLPHDGAPWCTATTGWGAPVAAAPEWGLSPEPPPAIPIAAACDGARKGSGAGGWGLVVLLSDGRQIERSGHEADTTNNRQELRAAIEALQLLATLPANTLTLETDSRYVVDGLTAWLPGWKRNGWRTAAGKPVLNRDLWEVLEAAAMGCPWVRLSWVKGHNGHPLNEQADRLASAAAERLQPPPPAAAAATTTVDWAEAFRSLQLKAPEWSTPAAPPDWRDQIPGIGLILLKIELQASGIPEDLAAVNVATFGPGTDRHWEHERAELVAHHRLQIQTESVSGNGFAQCQPGHLAARLIALDQRYRHLESGGWRTLSDHLPGIPAFDQWKPAKPRQRQDKPGRGIKYEAPPRFPDGGGLLLPRIPEAYWQRICEKQGLPLPDADTIAAGFWTWALATPDLQILICEGFKKALAAISCGYAALALPGIQNGRRRDPDGKERLIEALQLLSTPKRRWVIAFDAEGKRSTASKVAAAAGCLARALRAAGGRPEVARLPLLPGTTKTGLDDLLVAAGPEALDQALAATGPRPVLPWLRPADRTAPAGAYLGQACPLPSPEEAPLVIVQTPMGCGKTTAMAQALAPQQAVGVPILMPAHRKALGQAAAERVGVPWCPAPGSDERQQGVAGCWDSWLLDSALRISGHSWSGGVLVLDEWAQACEHLLLSVGTALGKRRRAAVLRTAADQLPRMRQTIAADAQMPDWAVALLERLTGRQALVIRSEHQPMKGRHLHCPEGFKSGKSASAAFRAQWAQLVAAGSTFLSWTSAQQAGMRNAPQTLAALHRQRDPEARILVIDSTTPEAAAELAADPDGVAEQYDAIYVSPAISSGISFERWKPAAVIAYSGGRIAPEHAAQALARVRCPEVPAYLFAPERCPGAAMRVGSGATKPAELIAHMRAVADPLLGVLEDAGDAWLEAWSELGAHRNRQRFAYRATIAGLLQREGWELQDPGPAHCPVTAAEVSAELGVIADAALAAEDQAVIDAPLITAAEAKALDRRRQRTPEEEAALVRYRISTAWGLGTAAPSLGLLEAHRNELREPLRRGWLLTTPEALALVPEHDRRKIEGLDQHHGRPFAPDRLRVALGPKLMALQALGVPQLLGRFAAGEVIAATDPAVIALHANAMAHRGQLIAAAGVSPSKLPTGTLRALLEAVGWELQAAGRIKVRGASRDTYCYSAQRVALPKGVNAEALAAAWLAELQGGADPGAKSSHVDESHMGEKSPSPPETSPPPPQLLQLVARVVAIPWRAAPPPPRSAAPIAA